jgi:hypothetical protein
LIKAVKASKVGSTLMRPYLILLGVLLAVFIGVLTFKHFQPSADRITSVAEQASQKKDSSICNNLPVHETLSGTDHDGEAYTADTYPREQCLMQYLRNTKD